ncbi:putative glycolipid-binding domain-containing protein [Nocardiopsis ansamitocini]|uniref:Glycolipid-binding family protein n=1 Tax=Nocardiopsis ansamitocini TaxID=1670832 RepID=A0A9W6UKA6_9ACTN|nr:putative glycolipid-binding domain-containing protein [Nocardiopsis ansamitocini]GLU49744.1 hypothetical protein Nans01_40950 [Nocardiopsis ansamitocini]
MASTNELPAAWSRLDVSAGLCVGTLITEPHGFRLEASEVVVVDAHERFSCRYTVCTDLAWVTRELRVDAISDDGVRTLELVRTAGQWWADGARVLELEGCVDVDVAAAPLTNTLPIRRLGLVPGQYRDINVAWVDVPTLRVQRMRQRYTRLAPSGGLDRYEYSDTDFGSYEFTVDHHGLVIDYERLARRIR